MACLPDFTCVFCLPWLLSVMSASLSNCTIRSCLCGMMWVGSGSIGHGTGGLLAPWLYHLNPGSAKNSSGLSEFFSAKTSGLTVCAIWSSIMLSIMLICCCNTIRSSITGVGRMPFGSGLSTIGMTGSSMCL